MKHIIDMLIPFYQEDYDRLRPLSYPSTDVFIITFSVTNRWSFDNIATKWVPEISHHCPDSPFIIVGTKCDLRKDTSTIKKYVVTMVLKLFRLFYSNKTMVSHEEAEAAAKKLGALCYIECSSLEMHNVDDIFKVAVTTAYMRRHSQQFGKKKDCILQ